MFWKGRVSLLSQINAAWSKHELALASRMPAPELTENGTSNPYYRVDIANINDAEDIAQLLNTHFEPSNSRAKTAVSAEWIQSTFIVKQAIWVVARDPLGKVRGCVTSFQTSAPYPNSLAGCSSNATMWSMIDWFCVEPLWRDIGVGSKMLEVLDFITYRVGRKAHMFIKEGLPLLSQMPFYNTFLRCRRAGNSDINKMREGTGLGVYMYHTVEKDTGLHLVRIEGLRDPDIDKQSIKEWEDALDRELPPCWVFVSGADHIDESRGWKLDSLVSVYAFRWLPGKWFGSVPNVDIV